MDDVSLQKKELPKSFPLHVYTFFPQIEEHFKGNNSACFSEIVHQFFVEDGTHWADVGDICIRSGFMDLADAIYDCYRTGEYSLV